MSAPRIDTWEDFFQWVRDQEALRDLRRRERQNRPYEDAVTPEEFDCRYPRS